MRFYLCVCVPQVTSVLNVHLAMLQLSLRPSFTLRASSGEPFFCCFVLRQKTSSCTAYVVRARLLPVFLL